MPAQDEDSELNGHGEVFVPGRKGFLFYGGFSGSGGIAGDK